MAQSIVTIATSGQGLYEFTRDVARFVSANVIDTGICNVYVRHTSCSLIIQENADPDVQTDLKAFFSRLVPPATDPSMDYLEHRLEGPDDMPAHIKAALTQTIQAPGRSRSSPREGSNPSRRDSMTSVWDRAPDTDTESSCK